MANMITYVQLYARRDTYGQQHHLTQHEYGKKRICRPRLDLTTLTKIVFRWCLKENKVVGAAGNFEEGHMIQEIY